jgi:hypothetical protein
MDVPPPGYTQTWMRLYSLLVLVLYFSIGALSFMLELVRIRRARSIIGDGMDLASSMFDVEERCGRIIEVYFEEWI